MGLRLKAELGGDGSGFDRMINKAGLSAKQFGTGVISPLKNLIAGAFTVGAITQLTRSTIDWASKLRDTADMLGVNVEWLQKMQNGAQLVGADIEDVAKFINEMNRARQEALKNPKGREAQAFGRLGASPGDIENLSTQAFFDKIVGAFKNGANTQLVNDVQEVGGRSARKLVGAFETQFDSDMNLLSEHLIDELDTLGDNFTSLGRRIQVGLAPALVTASEWIGHFIDWLEQIGAYASSMVGTDGMTQAERNQVSEDQIKAFQRQLREGKITPEQFKENTKGIVVTGTGVSRHEDGMRAIEAVKAEQAERDRKDQAAKDAAAAARLANANKPPMFDKDAITPKATAGRSSPDALVRVGNFLGSAPGSVNAIAEQQLKAAREQAARLKTANEILTRIEQKFGLRGGIGVPAL